MPYTILMLKSREVYFLYFFKREKNNTVKKKKIRFGLPFHAASLKSAKIAMIVIVM